MPIRFAARASRFAFCLEPTSVSACCQHVFDVQHIHPHGDVKARRRKTSPTAAIVLVGQRSSVFLFSTERKGREARPALLHFLGRVVFSSPPFRRSPVGLFHELQHTANATRDPPYIRNFRGLPCGFQRTSSPAIASGKILVVESTMQASIEKIPPTHPGKKEYK